MSQHPKTMKMNRYALYTGFIIASCLAIWGCQPSPEPMASTYKFIEPSYDNIELEPQGDSLHFALDTSSYNEIRTFNYFTHKGKPYIGLFDKRARNLVVYDFTTQQLVDKIHLKRRFAKGYTYVVNFDSIFVVNDKQLFLQDTANSIKDTIDLFEAQNAKAIINNETPAVLRNNVLYTGVQPINMESSIKAQRRWNVVCGFDLSNNTKKLYYQLPALYWKDLYGYSFLEYSYCINDRGNFVFSFPADTNIYETNLADLNNAYYAKSKFQSGPILPVSQNAIDSGESRREYYLRDAYGTIYYDPYQKRYLRFAKQKITKANYLAKKKERERSLIILNEDFKVIGESALSDELAAFKSIFFTPDGGIYIRTKSEDEQAIHFARLEYSDKQHHAGQLTLNKPLPPK